MKALSLWQPWASAIAIGAKTIETRGWWTPYRGPLAIHAAKFQNDETREFFTWKGCEALRAKYPNFDSLPFGAIVATCRITECLRTTDVDGLSPLERSLGDYTPGRYAWVLRDIVALETPIPFRGAQQLFECPLVADHSGFSNQPGLEI